MRLRVLMVILSLTAASCGGAEAPPASAARSVSGEWDAEAVVLRTRVVENAVEDGLTRPQTTCMLDEIAAEIPLERLVEFDLSATTGSGASGEEAVLLAEALATCGHSIRLMLGAAAPGIFAVPPTHTTEAECFATAYHEGIVSSYVDRFESRGGTGRHIVDIVIALRECEAAGALLLGASHSGHLETSTLTTLEWECVVDRLPASVFEPAFPFPDEPGDARDRLGSTVDADVAYCQAWVAGTPIEG